MLGDNQVKIQIEATKEERKQLIKSQQGELDAVILYRKLSEITKKVENKKTFLKIAADEGKHAVILKKYTGENLKAKNLKAIIINILYKVCGAKFTLKMIGKGEFKAAKDYLSLAEKFPNIKEIIKDENLHGELMVSMLRGH